MAAIWHESNTPSWLGVGPSYSFVDLPEIHQVAPASYEAARAEMRAREMLLGAEWFQHNTELAHTFWERKKPWWL